MKLVKSTDQNYLDFVLPVGIREVAVEQISFDHHLPYFSHNLGALTGAESLDVSACVDAEGLKKQINESKLIYADIVNNKWEISDTTGILGPEPEGLFERDQKRYVLQKNGNEYALHDFIDFGVLDRDEVIFWNENRTLDFTGAVTLAGTWSNRTLGQSGAKLTGTDLVADRSGFGADNEELVVGTHTKIGSLETNLLKKSRLSYEFTANDEIRISTIGQNNGILMESPFFGFINSEVAQKINDPLKVCSCGFVLRAMSLYHNESMEEVADIPVDTREMLFKWDADTTGSGKVEIYCIRKNGAKVLVLRTIVIPNNQRFVVVGHQNDFVLEPPVIFRKKDISDRVGSVACTFSRLTNETDYALLTCPQMELTVADGNINGTGTLVVSGVDTGLSVLPNNTYILSVSRYTDDLKVELWNSTASTLATHDAPSAPTFVDSVALDSKVILKVGNVFGSVGLCIDHAHVGPIIQSMRLQVDGIPLSSGNLGTYTDGNFQNLGATYSSNTFTLNANTYTRLPLNMSVAIKNALGFDSKEITGDAKATQPKYEKRVSSVDIFCKSIDLKESVACISNFDKNHQIQLPVFHNVRASTLRFTYKYYDAAHRHSSRKHIATRWGLTLSLR